MKNWMHLPLAAFVAALVGVGLALFATPERKTSAANPGLDEGALRAALQELKSEHEALAEHVATLAETSAPASGASTSRAPVQDLDQAVADFMARRLTDPAASDAPGLEPADLESAAIADRILSGQVRGDELEALWQKLREEKKIDGVLAEIERQAALEPGNPDLQSELGQAYLQKLFDVGIGPMAAAWGEKADRAFDRALELDDAHWEARFHKALALSNWPDFLGKQGEAIHQFELLMDRQERVAPSAEHAYTYFFLGNMYEQNGQREQALAAWQRGLERFPDSTDLRAKVEGN